MKYDDKYHYFIDPDDNYTTSAPRFTIADAGDGTSVLYCTYNPNKILVMSAYRSNSPIWVYALMTRLQYYEKYQVTRQEWLARLAKEMTKIL